MFLKSVFFFLFIISTFLSHGQVFQAQNKYTKADSLRGSLRPERTSFDVLKYNLNVKVEPTKRYISGFNTITFHVLETLPVMQLDLFSNMSVDSIVYHGEQLTYEREFNAVFISFKNALKQKTTDSLNFYFSGEPIVAKNPPWDGGFVFSHDKNGKDWIGVAVQGTGASLWYPNKDHQSDQPEEAEIHVAAPNGLMNVSNGRFIGKQEIEDDFTIWSWKVTNPINNYNLTLNIGDYVHFSDTFRDLDLTYYVLPYNLQKAKKQFAEVKPMMKCFYKHFGEYPFPEDAYKLIEAPYLGMEHQSAVAYGNNYQLGYGGVDVSQSGAGLNWDFIIIHESAHEWFGNSITSADIADMWIHEAFTSYAESVYIECRWGKEKALAYLKGMRKTMVSNKQPIIGDYGVNNEGGVDMYYKGANMLNTLRGVVNNDDKWWALLKEFSESFKHKITTTEEVIEYFEKNSDQTLTPIFKVYLYSTELPILQLKKEQGHIYFRWKCTENNFKMPIDLRVNKRSKRIYPSQEWKIMEGVHEIKNIKPDLDRFYIEVERL